MKTMLRFSAAEVAALIDHAIAAPNHSRGYGDKKRARPQLILVKDEGIYLMSNGIPGIGHDGEPIPKDAKRGTVHHRVVYARGFAPGTPDLWEKCRAAVGGDDFSEYIDVDAMLARATHDARTFLVRITEKQIAILTTA